MQSLSGLFKALASEQRIKIVRKLLDSDDYECYCEMEDVVDKDMSVIYRHFKKLDNAGVLETRKRGKRLEGRVKNPNKIRKILKIMEEIINES